MSLKNLPGNKFELTANDIDYITQSIAYSALKNESFQDDGYLDGLIEKPWGYEFRTYCDPFFDIWKLTIKPAQRTSVHCHPRKETILICLSGEGILASLDREEVISAGSYIHIDRGVFHSTRNISATENLELIEVENPRNKFDLVRIKDAYGRESMGYETTQRFDLNLPEMQTFESRFNYSCKLRAEDENQRYLFSIEDFAELQPGAQDFLFVKLGIEDHLLGGPVVINLQHTTPTGIDTPMMGLRIRKTR
ncbi:cupin domain-containing protein [Deinococcus roseus]|uniref:Cupin type-2 domain-containing protein n=1 Tax=Deinococcus roseus TaxID=392414 RepID=A0ABQ2D8I1_9DEIO|nr:cupin domain-containing protein [Deinococcus roseus]GGJ49550.1 hypothetical protein GCM10008938_39400 [Deinococcus roseus]